MKRIISIVWLLLTLTAIYAENNPYRSDVMWVTVPNHADWTYTTGEEAIVMTWGYNDNTCSPTTSYAVWNTLRCRKTSLITPINEHWTSDATNRAQMEWVKRHLADEDNPNDNN